MQCKVKLRLDELASLEDGWLEGEGRSYNQKEIDLVYRVVKEAKREDVRIYPDPDGEISLEWEIETDSFCFSFIFDEGIFNFHGMDLGTREFSIEKEGKLVVEDMVDILKEYK